MTPDKTNTHPEALDLDAAAKFAKYWQEATRFPSEVTRHIEELVAECHRLRAALRAPLTATAPGPTLDVLRRLRLEAIHFACTGLGKNNLLALCDEAKKALAEPLPLPDTLEGK